MSVPLFIRISRRDAIGLELALRADGRPRSPRLSRDNLSYPLVMQFSMLDVRSNMARIQGGS
jgi:hypothetical protein